ncbi:hypothetical protein CC78DRAFT_66701 [Lojkania enalia]|uniref:FAD/NAD(P)-binding domain-containing protein n=1 Tax=Lojkania enalia TaxID=147567 RepID=A0A9P4JZN0_9PLEO|nr:hypothetical protein CC78DRAFT_66701 [Didymosphaeria enalia]
MVNHEIVVLGANFAGVNLVHHLERQVLPLLEKIQGAPTYHVTLVSPSTHYFFKVGAPRALISPSSFPEDKLFRSIAEGLQQYGAAVTFVQGKAVALTPARHQVTVEDASVSGEIKYDSLFIATGTTSASPLWTLHGDHKISEAAIKEMHKVLPQTKSVLVAGAGPVGVEVSGEIAHSYPQAKVTLVGAVLERLKPGTITKAKAKFEAAKVELLSNLRVNETVPEGATTVVKLSDGSSRTVDLFIDARGAHKINSEYLPKEWLDEKGRVITGDNYFRVKGDDTAGVYAVGDIVSGSSNTALELDAQVPVVGSSFAVDQAAALGQDTASSGGLLSWIPGFGGKGISQKEFKPMKDTILIPIGPTGGVGQAMGIGMPNFMVKKAKAEKFFVELVDPAVTGSKYAKV